MRYSRMRQLAEMSLPELRLVLIRDLRKIPNARVKEMLREYQMLQENINANLDQIQVLRSLAQKVTVTYRDTPGGGPKSDKAILLNKVRKLENYILADTEKIKEALDRVRFLIDSLDNYLERQVLVLRYIRGWKDWRRIGDELNYTESHVKHVHGNAIKKLVPLAEQILMAKFKR